MSKDGLSLLGFMDQSLAITHLQTACATDPTLTDADLIKIHASAIANLGPATPNAGNPEIRDLPKAAEPHTKALVAASWTAPIFASLPGWQFKYIELAPLLAFQYTVLIENSKRHTSALSNPNLNDLLDVCLPVRQPQGEFKLTPVTNSTRSLLIKSADLNLNMKTWGLFPINYQGADSYFAGMIFQPRSPFVYVGRLNGRCYLANGYHRAYGLAKAGVTHVPCIFRDASSPEEIGIIGNGATFALNRLEAADPPTLAHFAQDRAWPVRLRMQKRYMHVSWSEYTLPEND